MKSSNLFILHHIVNILRNDKKNKNEKNTKNTKSTKI